MPKNPKPEQQNLPPAAFTPLAEVTLDQIGPFDVTCINGENAIGSGGVLVEVQEYNGADAYHVRENDGLIAYRTVQRMDLATRLQLPADYDPADLVGRTFLVPA